MVCVRCFLANTNSHGKRKEQIKQTTKAPAKHLLCRHWEYYQARSICAVR